MAQPESRLSRAIMAHLRANGVWCMKIHGGPTMMAGAPDILACVPVQVGDPHDQTDKVVGLFIGFETKMPAGHVSAIQRRVHTNIRNAYGEVYVVRSVQDVTDALTSMGWTPDPPDAR
jgi:hypothetical protein